MSTSSALAGIRVSLFIEPTERQVEAALAARRSGRRVPHRPLRPCRGRGADGRAEADRDCAALAVKNGIEPHAGHGLTFDNVIPVAAIPQIAELNIGHFLIGEAIFTGLDASVRRMRELMDEARGAPLSREREGSAVSSCLFGEDASPAPFRQLRAPSLSRERERAK